MAILHFRSKTTGHKGRGKPISMANAHAWKKRQDAEHPDIECWIEYL